MGKFCSNCGKELGEEQVVCLGCGVLVKKEEDKKQVIENKKHSGYITSTGIIMIVVGALLIIADGSEYYYDTFFAFVLPGLFSIASGIITLNAKKNKSLLLTSGILLFVGALFNVVSIEDISIFAILAVIFGIFNIIYSKEK